MAFASADMRRARIAVSLAFLVFGTQIGLWFAQIPELVRRLALEPAQLSLGIVVMSGAGLMMQPFAGLAISRFGGRRVGMLLLPAFVVASTLLIAAPSRPLFFVFAALTGLFGMPANVGINTIASEFERRHGRPAMSFFHGFFSVGGMLGSVLGGALLAVGLAGGSLAFGLGICLCAAAFRGTAHALAIPPEPRPSGGGFRVPVSAATIGIGLLALCTAVIEGAVGDWSALYLDTAKSAGPALAAGGYALFSVAMAAMRFAGGRIVETLGADLVLVAGGALIAVGMSVVVLSPWAPLSAFGFLVVALGAANLVPILTGLAANTPGIPPGMGIATVSCFLMSGFFAGPAAIGLLAQIWSLGSAFGLLAGLGVVIAVGAMARGWRRPSP
jgi:fucose permease